MRTRHLHIPAICLPAPSSAPKKTPASVSGPVPGIGVKRVPTTKRKHLIDLLLKYGGKWEKGREGGEPSQRCHKDRGNAKAEGDNEEQKNHFKQLSKSSFKNGNKNALSENCRKIIFSESTFESITSMGDATKYGKCESLDNISFIEFPANFYHKKEEEVVDACDFSCGRIGSCTDDFELNLALSLNEDADGNIDLTQDYLENLSKLIRVLKNQVSDECVQKKNGTQTKASCIRNAMKNIKTPHRRKCCSGRKSTKHLNIKQSYPGSVKRNNIQLGPKSRVKKSSNFGCCSCGNRSVKKAHCWSDGETCAPSAMETSLRCVCMDEIKKCFSPENQNALLRKPTVLKCNCCKKKSKKDSICKRYSRPENISCVFSKNKKSSETNPYRKLNCKHTSSSNKRSECNLQNNSLKKPSSTIQRKPCCYAKARKPGHEATNPTCNIRKQSQSACNTSKQSHLQFEPSGFSQKPKCPTHPKCFSKPKTKCPTQPKCPPKLVPFSKEMYLSRPSCASSPPSPLSSTCLTPCHTPTNLSHTSSTNSFSKSLLINNSKCYQKCSKKIPQKCTLKSPPEFKPKRLADSRQKGYITSPVLKSQPSCSPMCPPPFHRISLRPTLHLCQPKVQSNFSPKCPPQCPPQCTPKCPPQLPPQCPIPCQPFLQPKKCMFCCPGSCKRLGPLPPPPPSSSSPPPPPPPPCPQSCPPPQINSHNKDRKFPCPNAIKNSSQKYPLNISRCLMLLNQVPNNISQSANVQNQPKNQMRGKNTCSANNLSQDPDSQHDELQRVDEQMTQFETWKVERGNYPGVSGRNKYDYYKNDGSRPGNVTKCIKLISQINKYPADHAKLYRKQPQHSYLPPCPSETHEEELEEGDREGNELCEQTENIKPTLTTTCTINRKIKKDRCELGNLT